MPVPTIRAARRDDAAFIAWVILAASRSHLPRGAWDLTIDGSDEDCLAFLERMVVHEPHGLRTFCHWSRFLIAEVDGRAAAGLSGYDPAQVADVSEAIEHVLKELDWTAEDIAAGNARFVPFLTCVPEQPPGMWIVEWVAARPEFRRRGLVDALLNEVLTDGRRRSYERAQIGVLIGNTPAERAYLKAGFRPDVERRHPDFEALMGCPGISQLRRSL
jgi:ribosomal protein S18 acetylase RimI-like enzyme